MTRWAMAVSAVCLLGCFGSSGGGGAAGEGGGAGGAAPSGTTAGLPPSTPLSQVTMDDLVQVCRANEELVLASVASVEYQCIDEALAVASSASECEEFRSGCLSDLSSSADDDPCAFSGGGPDFSGCDSVTLAEMLGCMEDLAAFADTLDCSQVGTQTPYPQSCIDVDDACPSVL